MRRSSQETRKHLLDSAEIVVRRDGVNHLTFDAVVKESGVSKGGVLYHYSDKKSLIEGMLERLFLTYQDMLDKLYEAEMEGPGRWLRAYIRSSLQFTDTDHDLTSGLIAALASEPELLPLFEHEFIKWEERALNDGLTQQRAMVIKLAADGYWFGGIFNSQLPTDHGLRKLILDDLLSLTGIPS